jgi:hypothetical protein
MLLHRLQGASAWGHWPRRELSHSWPAATADATRQAPGTKPGAVLRTVGCVASDAGHGATLAACAARGRSRKGRGWWASHHRRGLPRPPRCGSLAPQAGQWRGGARLARRTIVADAAAASAASTLMQHPAGENPPRLAKPGRAHTVAGRGLRTSGCPYGLPRPRPSKRPSSSCRSGTALTCWRCRTAHRPRPVERHGRRSGRWRDGLAARSQGTSRRARHAMRAAHGC